MKTERNKQAKTKRNERETKGKETKRNGRERNESESATKNTARGRVRRETHQTRNETRTKRKGSEPETDKRTPQVVSRVPGHPRPSLPLISPGLK